MVSGKNLLDFPWPDGNNEREGMKLILSTRPLLNAHVERWSKRVMEALGRRGGERVGDVFVEEYLRELWERSRAWSGMLRSAGQAIGGAFHLLLGGASSQLPYAKTPFHLEKDAANEDDYVVCCSGAWHRRDPTSGGLRLGPPR
jgi:hypothetical protein